MRKSIKTIGIISLLTIATVGSYALGLQTNADETTTEEFHNNYLDLRTVTGYSTTNDSLLLYTDDDNSYQLDTESIQQDDNTLQIYCINTINDYNQLIDRLETRDKEVIVEVINGEVTDGQGNGKDDLGYYIHYDSKQFFKGERVQTILIYNPDTNYSDDILYRIDSKVE